MPLLSAFVRAQPVRFVYLLGLYYRWFASAVVDSPQGRVVCPEFPDFPDAGRGVRFSASFPEAGLDPSLLRRKATALQQKSMISCTAARACRCQVVW